MGENLHKGHRARLLQRLVDHEDSLQDHELLEIILYNAIPRKNTNEIAHALLNKFGSLAGVLHASPTALCTVPGVGPTTAAYLACITVVHERAGAAPALEYPSSYNFAEFSKFLEERLRATRFECMELYAADNAGRVFGVERFTSHNQLAVELSPRQFTAFLYKYAPQGILIAHNHPTNASRPSHQDDLFTRKMMVMCDLHEIKLLDHMIVGVDSLYSYCLNNRFDFIKSLPFYV